MLSKTIKLSLLFCLTVLMISGLQAQEDKSKRPSPPATAEQTVGASTIKIEYSQPSVNGRTIFGDLVPYGEIWRTGANEATVFETSRDITVEGKALPAGRYAMFTIPNKDSWTIIFNTESDQWGAYRYKDAKDKLRIDVKAENASANTEKLNISIGNDGKVTIKWADKMASFTVAG